MQKEKVNHYALRKIGRHLVSVVVAVTILTVATSSIAQASQVDGNVTTDKSEKTPVAEKDKGATTSTTPEASTTKPAANEEEKNENQDNSKKKVMDQKRYDFYKEYDDSLGKIPTLQEYTKREYDKLDKYKKIAEKGIKENYWSDIVWHENKNDGFGAFIPKDLIPYIDKNKLDWEDKLNRESGKLRFPNMGIKDETDAAKAIVKEGSFGDFDDELPTEMTVLEGPIIKYNVKHQEAKDPKFNHWKGGKPWNPYHFDADKDLVFSKEIDDYYKKLSQGEEAKLNYDFNIRADIKEHGEKIDSTKMVEHHIGDKIHLDFVVDTDLVRRIHNSSLLGIIGSEFPAHYTMLNNTPETGLTQADGAFVYRMKLPKGLKPSQETGYTITGAPDDFEMNVKNYDEKNNEITVGIRMKDVNPDNDKNKFEMLKDRFKKMQQLGKITLSVTNLEIGNDVEINKPSQVIGRSSGVYEWFYSTSDEALKNQDPYPFKDQYRHKDQLTTENSEANHSYGTFSIMFAAKQAKDGIDEALEKDDQGKVKQPNLISYSFIVKANTVTFMNDDKKVAEVKVEPGKAIATDKFVDQSMPANAQRDHYSFVGWNQDKAATTAGFDGNTPVSQDLTVYAIFKNKAPQLKVHDATINVNGALDLTSLIDQASDTEDTALSKADVVIDAGKFDNTKAGVYAIQFSLTDGAKTTTTATAKVTVQEPQPKPKPEPTPTPQPTPTPTPQPTPEVHENGPVWIQPALPEAHLIPDPTPCPVPTPQPVPCPTPAPEPEVTPQAQPDRPQPKKPESPAPKKDQPSLPAENPSKKAPAKKEAVAGSEKKALPKTGAEASLILPSLGLLLASAGYVFKRPKK